LRRRTERTKQLSEVCNARVASTRALQEKFVSHVIYLAGVLPGAPRTLDRLVYGGARTTGWWSPWWPLASGSAVRRKAGHTSEPEHWFTITRDYAQFAQTGSIGTTAASSAWLTIALTARQEIDLFRNRAHAFDNSK